LDAAAFGLRQAVSQKPQRPIQSVYKNGCPLLPLLLPKNLYGRGNAKPFPNSA